MTPCDWCSLSEEDKRYLLCENGCWFVFLADEQDYVGRCILVLKRHCGSMAELTDDEWKDLLGLVRELETCIKTVFGADLCNWSCLMNSFFMEPEPCPHLHIHVRPRYRNPVMINGNAYSDDCFGHHYSTKKSGRISIEDMQAIFLRMKSWLDSQIPVFGNGCSMELIEPTAEVCRQIRANRKESPDCGDPMGGTDGLRCMEDPEKWVEHRS